MRKTAVVFLAVLGLTVGACGGSADEESSDPWGLDAVTEPTSQEEINVIFLAMPDEIDGMTAHRDDGDHVGYVEYRDGDSFAMVSPTQVGDDRATTVEQLESFADRTQFAELGSGIDAEATPVWLWGTVAEEDDLQILYWGDPEDGYLFMFEADTAEHLDALVSSFVASATTS
ncbi:MAG: hypothetical protein PVF87_07340 [Acidimicrobiia bacterium]|jgi:hypothetical protein